MILGFAEVAKRALPPPGRKTRVDDIVDAYKNIVYSKTYHGAFEKRVKYDRLDPRP